MYRIIGRCSNCGGDVIVPQIWHGIHPPKPSYVQCHAVAADTRKTIKMEPRV